jgi:nucleotide-binding universal stress UspA family protein
MHVVPSLPPLVSSYVERGVVEDYYRDEARKVIEPVMAFAHQHGWTVEVRTPVGRAADLIAETASAGRYDMVVLGSHGHTPMASAVLGSVAQRVLAQCDVPVLVVQ